jgi:hypothetical protein
MEAQANRPKPLPNTKPPSSCVVCAEVDRQGGGGCPKWKTTTKDGWTHHKQDGLCKWQSSEIVPPWCAGATEDERALFVAALPGEKRDVAIIEAQRANFQEGAKQETEAPKKVAKKRGAGQSTMF